MSNDLKIFIPREGRIVCIPYKLESKSKILLPESEEYLRNIFEVISVGPNIDDVMLGDLILVSNFHHTATDLNGQRYFVVKIENVEAILPE